MKTFFLLTDRTGVSKIHYTDFKNVHLTLKKIHPKEVLPKEFGDLASFSIGKTVFG
jgi:hypothetical protein